MKLVSYYLQLAYILERTTIIVQYIQQLHNTLSKDIRLIVQQ